MIPRISERGHSFTGAGLYYLHDKGTMSSERVAFTETLNLSTNNAQQALRFMADTALHAEELKKHAGVSTAGAKQMAGPVYIFSLSWHPDDRPNKAEMMRCAYDTLALQGLSEHEVVAVAHSDTDHAHIHVIVNLVHPERGTIADLSYNKRRLSAWALDYERSEGVIRCPEREKNARARSQGSCTKYQDQRQQQAQQISLFFEHSESGTEFITMMQDIGLNVARGDRGRIVIVNKAGEIQNLTRQLPKGIGKKAVLEKLSDIDVNHLPLASDLLKQQQRPPQGGSDISATHIAAIAVQCPETPPEEPPKKSLTEPQSMSLEEVLQDPVAQTMLENARLYQQNRLDHKARYPQQAAKRRKSREWLDHEQERDRW